MSSTEVAGGAECSIHHKVHCLRMKMLNWWEENQTCKNKEAPTLMKPVLGGSNSAEV